ncbi:unnamed protein product [Protopolystoma xenopodis]|uniref:Uncharacterized protein n=1 Tax=Protopolystoma xenopodis TaxID=117903 RepID=A0A3S5CIT8_9PLAT|nr:unnamed protein product [Protopolystoma xenopodis]
MFTLHSSLLWQTEFGLITLVIYPDPSLSMGSSDSGLESRSTHCLVDPLLIFLVDRFPSVQGPRSTYTAASRSRAPKL